MAEAMTSGSDTATPDTHDAQFFMNTLNGGREIVETESSVYRRTDVVGDGYRVFELMSLLPKSGFMVHITKMKQ